MEFNYVVVDGSNIATEARSLPSLVQLDEAVRGFLEQNKVAEITVIVDATFGHRIDPSEREEYDAAVANAEIITPPAGTVGRGDAFILQVAQRANATILSNDSFQEFHGQYEWLFEDDRLLGGKPIPGIGWVFTPRTPVRGPISRRSTRDSKNDKAGGNRSRADSRGPKKSEARTPKAKAAAPANEPSSSSSRRRRRGGKNQSDDGPSRADMARPAPSNDEPVNDLLPFLEFLGAHPIGSDLDGVVERYASHGAYVVAGGASCYVPLKSMGSPPPVRARDLLDVGGAHRFRVEGIDTPRRGIDLSLVLDANGVAMAAHDASLAVTAVDEPESATTDDAASRRSRTRRSAIATIALDDVGTTTATNETAEEAQVTPVKKKAPAKKAPAKKVAAKKAPAKKVAAKKAPAKKVAAKKAPAKKAVAKKAPAKKAPARKAAAKKAPARKAAAKKAPAKKAPAKKAVAKKAPAKKAPARKAAAKKAPARRR